MSLSILSRTPEQEFLRAQADLKLISPDLDFRRFKAMSSDRLYEEIDRLSLKEKRLIDNLPYGEWFGNHEYVECKLLQDALTNLADYKKLKEDAEFLVPGFTYYRNVKQFGPKLIGESCLFLGENRPVNWRSFTCPAPVLKALEVLRHGTKDDFKKIYVEAADGRADGLNTICLEHISESSGGALAEIDAYCNTRWEGPWPWESASPYKLRKRIEEKRIMRQKTLQEMKAEFESLLVRLQEGEAEKFEVVSFAKDMADKIQSMVENLARLAGEGIINLKDKARTVMGDDAAMRIEHEITSPMNIAADSLSKLKVAVEKIANDLTTGDSMMGMGGMPGGDMGMGGMGSPGGDMGMSPQDGLDGAELPGVDGADGSDDMADVSPDDLEPERARKDM